MLLNNHQRRLLAVETQELFHRRDIRESLEYSAEMKDATIILSAIESGDDKAIDDLMPLVYNELRRLSAAKLAKEDPGHTLSPTALVHEAYLRLVDTDHAQSWKHRNHFIAAAAEAMRRILVERARQKNCVKHGGEWHRVQIDSELLGQDERLHNLATLDIALTRLEQMDARKAQLIKLRYFAGMTYSEAADVLGISVATAERDWAYSRVWLLRELKRDGDSAISATDE